MKKTAFLIIVVCVFWGCTTLSQSYKLGSEAAINKNWDKAIIHYERALAEDPNNSIYRLALLRAKIAASYVHLIEARKLVIQGKKEDALNEYEKALFYDPFNIAIAEEARALTKEEVEEEVPRKMELELPVKLKVNGEKIHLKFPVDAPLRSIFQALGKHAEVNIIFDEQFKDIPFAIDIVDMDFEQAVKFLCLASKNFYRIVDERTIIIAPDTVQKRLQYELNAIKTFYLSNIKAQDIRTPLTQMLRTQFKPPNIIIDEKLNSVTIRDVPSVVELAGKIIQIWDRAKGEVVIDLEIMEVSRIKLRELGLDFDQYAVGAKYKSTTNGEDIGWIDLGGLDFSKSENYQITLPVSILKFLESDADTKMISQPRLRGVDGEEIKYIVGEEVPIPRTTFTPIAAGGVSQQPVTSFDYKNVGIDVLITPRIHKEKEITLEIEIKIKSLGGTGYADLPIITTREVKNVIRLRDGETNLLAGLLKDEERKTIRGIAGLKNIPLVGSLFSKTDQTIQQTDVVLTITPHIIRTGPLSEEDLEPLWFSLEGSSPSQRTIRGFTDEAFFERRREEERREERAENLISLSPSNVPVPQNREFRIRLNIRSEDEIGNLSLSINFNAEVLNLKEVTKGGILSRIGKDVPFLKNIDNSSGICTIGVSSPQAGRGFEGSGSVATLVFQAKAKGESVISVSSVTANGPDGKVVSFTTSDSRVTVQ